MRNDDEHRGGEPVAVRVIGPPVLHYVKVTGAILALFAVLALLWTARTVCVTVFLGLFLAAGLDPVVRRIQRVVPRRGLAVLLLVTALLVVLALLLAIVLRPAVTELRQLAGELPGLFDRISAKGGPLGSALDQRELRQHLQDAVKELPKVIGGSAKAVFGIVKGVASAAAMTATTFILMIYFLLAWPRMLARLERALRDPERIAVAHESLGKVGGYVTGQACISILAGAAAYAFLKIAGVPYPSLLAVVVGICDFIPQIGATLGAVICTLTALGESLGVAVATLVFFLVYQHVENYLIAPRVFSKAVELSPVAVFVSALFGVSVGGFVGAVIALPLTAALKVVATYLLRTYRPATD
ncbi:AI-2E family transporter [Actinomadura gamaensis]|uniref:AI-2E family transporter n=1 Tax=Actinomadura gamaensis TaxID=1763541 RepID=A0ABV9TW49_9ACTN